MVGMGTYEYLLELLEFGAYFSHEEAKRKLNITDTSLKHHLRVLRKAGFIKDVKMGKWRIRPPYGTTASLPSQTQFTSKHPKTRSPHLLTMG